ncbi:HAMP domain-containing sensor histidine kinase [Porifericola rhodea]|uniref:sensor histidine kinase n=1 Tax=Porifericola rhodea TaxID=930972 RepID=UPI002666D067|nr:HAMP domain-containing sensor histidine kinase [Porifericola rhodea]WKN32962.1 HAMP domain-containing sensor histidine kinase [Porifericola rhodea]
MDHLDFVNKSLRLRYEAFSKFATKINRANSVDEISSAIASDVKFVIDAFVLRLTVVNEHNTYTLELFREQCSFHQNLQDQLSPLERASLANGQPLSLNKTEIQNSDTLRGSIFDHPKAQHLLILPTTVSDEQRLIFFIANKSEQAYTEIDFRFANLISELLTTKISQLLLIKQIADNNKALEEANQQLSQLNEEVRTLNSELELKVDERTGRLKEAHIELNTLFYRTSHDFRRPLSAVLGLLDLMEMNPDTEEQPIITQHLRTSVQELDRMLNKLQTISLTDLDDEAVECLNFEQIIERLSAKYECKLKDQGIEMSYRIHLQGSYYAHPMMVEAIMDNIIENSICYCNKYQPYITIDIGDESGQLLIQIADNGDGIEPQLQHKVFDMYTKTSARSTGNGLGLYIVKKLMDKLKGKIILKSTFQQGTSVGLHLPLPQTPPSLPAQNSTVLSPH